MNGVLHLGHAFSISKVQIHKSLNMYTQTYTRSFRRAALQKSARFHGHPMQPMYTLST